MTNLKFEMVCEQPPRSLRSRLPLTRGRLPLQRKSFILPLRERGRAAEDGRGSLTHYLELAQPPRVSESLATHSEPDV
jgi:hypothetical protein